MTITGLHGHYKTARMDLSGATWTAMGPVKIGPVVTFDFDGEHYVFKDRGGNLAPGETITFIPPNGP